MARRKLQAAFESHWVFQYNGVSHWCTTHLRNQCIHALFWWLDWRPDQDWEGDLHSHGTDHWRAALWADEGHQGRREDVLPLCPTDKLLHDINIFTVRQSWTFQLDRTRWALWAGAMHSSWTPMCVHLVLVTMRGVWSSLRADCWCHSTWKLFLEFRHLPNIQLSSGVCAFESCPSPHDWFSKVMVLLSHALTFPRCHCISNMVKWGESQQNLVKFGDSAIRIWWIKVLHWLPSAHPGSPAHCGRCLQRPQTRS